MQRQTTNFLNHLNKQSIFLEWFVRFLLGYAAWRKKHQCKTSIWYVVLTFIWIFFWWAAFDHKSVWKPILTKFYATVLIICKTLWLFYVLKYSDADADLEKRLFSQQVVFSLTVTVLVVLVCSSIVKSAFFDNKNWILLFQNFYILDKHLKSVTEEKNIGRCYAKIFIKHLLFITLLGHGVWIFSTSAKFSFLKLFLFFPVIHLYWVFDGFGIDNFSGSF